MRFDELRSFQRAHEVWLNRNFPGQVAWEPLLGVVEEAGELAHHFLKDHQKIRTNEDHAAEIQDAVGDIVIYLASFCNTYGIDLAACVSYAWEEVKIRDWRSDPEKGQGTPVSELPTTTASRGTDERPFA